MRLAALVLACFLAPLPLQAITIETVPVGNPGNAADMQPFGTIGAVDHEFEIGETEVTNAQYVAFLNTVDPSGANPHDIYNSKMMSDALGGVDFSAAAAAGMKYTAKSGRADDPVVFVSFYDAARFANWLHNGQGAGGTEDGAYLLSDAEFITRKITASWCLPSADEWFKAAYHKNDGVTGNYFEYPTSSDVVPTAAAPPGAANTANFNHAVDTLTPAGAYTSAASPYGTYDQGGNVWEWTDTATNPQFGDRVVAGGSWMNNATYLAASTHFATLAVYEYNTIGFRVARVEPGVLPGDYNHNGYVDAADYTVWRDTLGSTTDLRANGDDTGESQGLIDQADYDFWKMSFAQSTGGGTEISPTSVPEPTCILLLLPVTMLLSVRPPRRRHQKR